VSSPRPPRFPREGIRRRPCFGRGQASRRPRTPDPWVVRPLNLLQRLSMSPREPRLPRDRAGIEKQIFDEFSRETDRAAAVLVGSYLDALLEDLLRTLLVDEGVRRGGRPLLNGALVSFTNRVDAAYALGLISTEEASDLSTINEIRNVFAHQLLGVSFKTPSVQALCDKLTAIEGAAGRVEARMLFLTVAALLSFLLTNRGPEIQRLEPRTNVRWPLGATSPK